MPAKGAAGVSFEALPGSRFTRHEKGRGGRGKKERRQRLSERTGQEKINWDRGCALVKAALADLFCDIPNECVRI